MREKKEKNLGNSFEVVNNNFWLGILKLIRRELPHLDLVAFKISTLPTLAMVWKIVLGCVLAVTVVAPAAWAVEVDYEDGSVYDEEGRLLIIPIGGTGTKNLFTPNITTLAAIGAALASALITLLGIAALGFLLYSLIAGKGYYDSGYGGSSGYGSGGGYSSYSSYRR